MNMLIYFLMANAVKDVANGLAMGRLQAILDITSAVVQQFLLSLRK